VPQPPRRRLARLRAFLARAVLIVPLLAAVDPGDVAHPAGDNAALLSRVAEACNGSAVLCSRRVDEVTFAAAHNAMSSAVGGWLRPNQAEGIPAQLDAGIRGFLIDTHYWEAPDELPPVLAPLGGLQRALLRESPGAPREVYLCHGLCSGGATPLTTALDSLRHFLDAHPDEVVMLVIEDHVRPSDTERAFRDAGLLPRVYTHPLGTPWPTLGALVGSRHQLIVQAEHAGRVSTWYGPMYREFWDTSYRVASAEAFDCTPGRGNSANALLLLNHWVTRPNLATAERVNSRQALLAHVGQCVDAHGRVPNLLAADFATVGDLVAVVAELNARAAAGALP